LTQDAITLFEVLSGRVVWIDVGDHDAVHIGCYSQLLTNPRRKVLDDNASQGARRGRPSAAGSISEIGRSGTSIFHRTPSTRNRALLLCLNRDILILLRHINRWP
jgi:hypothetical protein